MFDCPSRYLIAGNFRGRKLLWISRFCCYSRKFSLRNLKVWHLLAVPATNPRSFFQFVNVFFFEIRYFPEVYASTVYNCTYTTHITTHPHTSQIYHTHTSHTHTHTHTHTHHSRAQVYLRSRFIMNGVCVQWVGWIDLETLNGKARLVYDEEQAKVSQIPSPCC